MEHRRKILLLKFKHDNMEQTLSEENFIYTNNADPIEEEENKCTINATIRNIDTTNTNGNENEDSSIEITAVSIAVSSSASISVKESKCIDHHCLQQSEEFTTNKESQYLIIDRKNNKSDSVTRSSSSTSTTTVPNQCIICLQEYKPNDVIVWSENPLCLHCYHRDCILEYLVPLIDLENNNKNMRALMISIRLITIPIPMRLIPILLFFLILTIQYYLLHRYHQYLLVAILMNLLLRSHHYYRVHVVGYLFYSISIHNKENKEIINGMQR